MNSIHFFTLYDVRDDAEIAASLVKFRDLGSHLCWILMNIISKSKSNF